VTATDGTVQFVLPTESEITQLIGRWLRNSTDRKGGRSKRCKNGNSKEKSKKKNHQEPIGETSEDTENEPTIPGGGRDIWMNPPSPAVDGISDGDSTVSEYDNFVTDYFTEETPLYQHLITSNNQIDSSQPIQPPTLNSSPSFAELLRKWSVTHNITHSALKDLLKIISISISQVTLPKDLRTVLRTPRSASNRVIQISGGQFYHFGLTGHLKRIAMRGLKECNLPSLIEEKHLENLLTLKIGIDGIPISKVAWIKEWGTKYF